MTPKKWQDSVEKMAQHFGVPEEFAKALIDAYYKQVRTEIAEINKPSIEIYGLGRFSFKYYKVKYRLRDVRAYIMHHQKSNTPRSLAILQTLYRKLAVLEKANIIAERIARNIVTKRNERKKYIAEKQVSLEKSQENTGGNVEHTLS